MSGVERCGWCGDDPLYVKYHDEEWGVPVRDDDRLFEMLTLEGAQAGLSWITVLRKRERYREVFHGFEIARVARMTARDVERILNDDGPMTVVRHRGKIESTISNAKCAIAAQQEFGSLAEYLWSFVGGEPMVNRPATLKDVPANTSESDAMSRALKKRGFKFVGSTICYAFMQATGMVDDHLRGCFRCS
ncbi:MAG: DNA-3-methyladenine glycosylase I [Phycisphaeraceae bacterium]|nr:DNA-3-methyladenine glycosylase I [Phycisphaerales bacterium]MCB9844197.1 DNA-3-methyladenine glycosylase I [Phycisphaeraceae bacterium]